MKLETSFTVPLPVEQAWQVLQDLERVAPCVPGAALDGIDGDSFTGRVRIKVGPRTLTYAGSATFEERDAGARSLFLTASGRETRGSGTATASVQAELRPEGEATRVALATEVGVTDHPVQLGQELLAEIGGNLLDQFARCLVEEIRSGPAVPTPPPVDAVPLAAPVLGADAAASRAVPVDTSAPSPAPRAEPQRTEALDLLITAGLPMVRRFAPGIAAAVVAVLVVRLLRRR